jgi:hydrogenase nickel incorporation protein HypB
MMCTVCGCGNGLGATPAKSRAKASSGGTLAYRAVMTDDDAVAGTAAVDPVFAEAMAIGAAVAKGLAVDGPAAGASPSHNRAPAADIDAAVSVAAAAAGVSPTQTGASPAVAESESGALHFGHGPAGAHVPGMSQRRLIRVERDILDKNDAYAADNRRLFAARGMLALNLVSSPGAGKTTLLVRTLERLRDVAPVAVIEGDQQTSCDAERIRATGVAAIQINTGKGCHLDASMVKAAVARLDPAPGTVLMIENVGNLVCPAAFDLGEAHKVVVLSVTEGEDKPLKYPDMFRAATLMLLNKCDLLPYVPFDVAKALEYARRVNPTIDIIRTSATSGEGLDAWLGWIARARPAPIRTVLAEGR